MSNTFTKFIDSCVGAIARKVQDEFDESKHPRDKGGKFSSKGGESRGEGGLHHAGRDVEKYGKDLEAKHKETVEKQKARRGVSELEETDFEKEAKKEIGSGKESGSEGDDDEGYMGMSKEELAEEEEYENARERARREKDDDRVTGPEDRDYMNEEDDDDGMYYGPDLDEIKKYATDKLKEYGVGDPKFTSKSTIKYRENGTQSISIPMDQYGRVLHVTADPKSNSIRVEYYAGVESFTTKLEGYGHREMAQALDKALQRIDARNADEREYWKSKNKEAGPAPKPRSFYE